MSEAGYCLVARDALVALPAEITLRALARAVNAVGGRETPLRLAKLEALLASLVECPKAAHTLGGCRLQPAGERLGVFRETRGTGLPTLRLAPGERALWDNRFRVELEASASGAGHRRRARRGALARSSCLSPLAHGIAALRRRHAAACLAGGSIMLPRLGTCSDGGDEATTCFRARFVNAPSTRRI